MINKIIKGFLGIITLTISPFIMLAIVGILYVTFQMIGGVSFTAGVESFVNFIYSLVPFFSYLTAIPVAIVLTILFIKNRQKQDKN